MAGSGFCKASSPPLILLPSSHRLAVACFVCCLPHSTMMSLGTGTLAFLCVFNPFKSPHCDRLLIVYWGVHILCADKKLENICRLSDLGGRTKSWLKGNLTIEHWKDKEGWNWHRHVQAWWSGKGAPGTEWGPQTVGIVLAFWGATLIPEKGECGASGVCGAPGPGWIWGDEAYLAHLTSCRAPELIQSLSQASVGGGSIGDLCSSADFAVSFGSRYLAFYIFVPLKAAISCRGS